ncbi:MAG: hypothetical protein ACK4NF_00010 [Planctomycetota bacterium]
MSESQLQLSLNINSDTKKYVCSLGWIMIPILLLFAIIHIVYSYYEREHLLILKENKVNQIERIKRNIRFYNMRVNQIKNDKDFFINLMHKKYMVSLENEFYINE